MERNWNRYLFHSHNQELEVAIDGNDALANRDADGNQPPEPNAGNQMPMVFEIAT